MADSVEEPKPQEPLQEKPVEALVTSKTMRTASGKFRTMQIDPKTHKFIKQPKKMPDSRELTRNFRNWSLSKLEVDSNGQLTKSSKTIMQNMLESMYKIAMLSYGQDAKSLVAAVAAYKELKESIWGKNPPSDAELGALERAGVRVVVLTDPSLSFPKVETYEEREHSKPEKPSFADAPFIEGEVVSPPPEDDKK